MNPFFRTDLSISDSLKTVRKSVLNYETIIIQGTLIRCGTCGNSDKCDYCVVGSESPLAQKYEVVKDEGGFLVSREKA